MKWNALLITAIVPIILAVFSLCQNAQADPKPYHELKRFPLGGEGGWDYLKADPKTRKLYIARSTAIWVVDLDSGKLIAEIPGVEGAHGVALNPTDGKGYATSGKDNGVLVFDLKTFKPITKIAVGENPDAILYDDHSKQVFVFNGKSDTASVIDAQTLKVTTTIPLTGKPEFAATDGKGNVYVNIENLNDLAVIDAKKNKVMAEYNLSPCESPTGLSIDVDSHFLFVGCGNKMAAIVDADTGKVNKTIPVGEGVDATFYDPKRKLAFVSAGEGKLSIIEKTPQGFALREEVNTQNGARTMAYDQKTGHLWLATAQFGDLEPMLPGQTHPRHRIVPGSFYLMVFGK